MKGVPFSRGVGAGGWARASAMQKVRLGAAGRGAAPLRAQLLQAVAMGGVAAAVCDGPLSAARSRDPLLCTPMPIDGVLWNGKLLNAVLHGPRRSASRDGPLCMARSRDPLLCSPMPIDGVLCSGKLLNAVL